MMKNPHPSRRRVYVLLGFFCAFLVLFFAVLYDAQVVHGSENRARSITSNTASETVTASRGIITDRNGKVLVSNRLAYTLVVDKSSLLSSRYSRKLSFRLLLVSRGEDPVVMGRVSFHVTPCS